MEETQKKIIIPITKREDDFVYVDVDFTLILPHDVGLLIPESVNHELVAQIKKWHSEGRNIIIWTSNPDGREHCRKAAKLCGIEEYIYDYLPKPRLIVDDDHIEYYRTMDPITLEIKESNR